MAIKHANPSYLGIKESDIGCEDIRATRQIVLYPGDERYNLDAKTEVMPLRIFLSDVLRVQAA